MGKREIKEYTILRSGRPKRAFDTGVYKSREISTLTHIQVVTEENSEGQSTRARWVVQLCRSEKGRKRRPLGLSALRMVQSSQHFKVWQGRRQSQGENQWEKRKRSRFFAYFTSAGGLPDALSLARRASGSRGMKASICALEWCKTQLPHNDSKQVSPMGLCAVVEKDRLPLIRAQVRE